MTKYLVRASYNGSGFRGMISKPSDRGEAIKKMTAALSITTECVYFSPSTGEAIMIIDSDVEKNARLMMVVMSSDTFTGGSIIDLIDTDSMMSAMQESGSMLGAYKSVVD
ncbi:hypothetical protein [Thalassobium sp. R2A62]|uniref:hypothetical protein n=1 Tax=Thalassobium sp. R2A62 TaxID=633131 RepID=UPI000592A692|nr:hypothetical protein [Thalassobium sp. R2A62]